MNFEPILYGPLFVRDAPDINLVASGADPVEVTVAVGGSSWPLPVTPVLTDGRYLAPLRMREILGSVVGIPGLADAGEREVPLVTLTAEGTSMSLRAVYGGAAGKTPTELAGHWLSWRDQVSKTYAWGRERLTFLAGRDLLGWRSGSYSVKAKVYLASGDPVTVTLVSGTLPEECRYVTVDASYAAIAALVSGTIRAWDVSYSFSGRDSGNANASLDGFPLRLVLARQDVRVKEFVFCNSFGVEDRVYSSGRSNPKLEGASVAFLNGAVEQELRNDATEGREVFSGYLGSARESALWLDFLKAHERHILLSGGLARIIVDTQDTDLQDNAIGSVKFTYHLGALDAGRHFDDLEGLGEYDPTQRYGALYVGDEPASEDLPTEDLFFLKTRLDEFPAADLDYNLLFLVQNPLTQAWGNASLNGIKEYLQRVITREDVRVWTGPWTDYSAGVAGYALSAGLGRDLYDRIRNIETHPTDLSDYYTKSQTDTVIQDSIAGKVDESSLKTLTLKVGTATIGQAYNPIGTEDQTLTIAENDLTALLDDNYHPLYGEHDASAEKYFWIGGAKLVWHPAVGNTEGYLELQSALVTAGDQIVVSGTPGQGGGGGGAGYLYELNDVADALRAPSTGTMIFWNGSSWVGNTLPSGFGAGYVPQWDGSKWTAVAASSIGGVTSVVGQTGAVTAEQISSALSLGAAATYGVGSVTSGNTGLVTGGAVWSAIDALPKPMVFKGSLGTGGTITSLPVNGTAQVGDTYKVITAGTYAGQTAKVGDTFICQTKTASANTWVLLPSGDEPEGTVTSVGLSLPVGLVLDTVNGSASPITDSGTFVLAFQSGYAIPTTEDVAKGVAARGYFNSSGVLTYNHGGTGRSSAWTANSVIYASSTSALGQVTNVSGNSQKKFLVQTTNSSGVAQAPAWGSLAFSDLPTLYWANVAISNSSSATTEPTFASVRIGDAEITWVEGVGGADGYLQISTALVTQGDQIVVSGTPGQGGGGGASFLTELRDVYPSAKPSARKILVFDPAQADKDGNRGAWVYADVPTGSITSVSLAQGAANGTVHLVVNGTAQADVAVKGLGSLAYLSSLAFSDLSTHPTSLSGYGIKDAKFGTAGSDYVPVTLGSTTKNVLTAHQSLSAYLTSATAADTYQPKGYYVEYDKTTPPADVNTTDSGTSCIHIIHSGLGTTENYTPGPYGLFADFVVSAGHLQFGTNTTQNDVYVRSYWWATRSSDSTPFPGYPAWVKLYHSANLTKSVLTGLLEGSNGYYVKKSGDEMSGALTFAHDIGIYGKDSNESARLLLYLNTNNHLVIGNGLKDVASGGFAYLRGIELHLQTAARAGTYGDRVIVNSSGNVTIGSSDFAETSYKLYVNGAAKVTGQFYLGTSSVSSFNFVRGSANYFTAPADGYFAFVPNGLTSGISNSPLVITAGSIYPGAETDLGRSSSYWHYAYANRVYLADGAYLEYNTNGYIYISKPIVTEGDQIVVSGTPGGGGGGGGAGFVYELKDTLAGWTSNTGVSTGQVLMYQVGADSKNGTGTGAWKYGTLAISNISGLQSALDGKQASGNYVTSVKVGSTSYAPLSGVVSLPAYPTSLPASDVYAWAKAATKPSYTLDEVADGSNRKLSDYLYGTSNKNVTIRATDSSNTWGAVGFADGDNTKFNLYSIRFGATPGASYGGSLLAYGSGIMFGGNDTRGFIALRYGAGHVEFGGGSVSAPTTTVGWHFGINGTDGVTYDLPTIATNASNGATAYSSLSNYVLKGGDIMTGLLTLKYANPRIVLQAADGTTNGVFAARTAGAAEFYDGTQWRTIWHTGNLTPSNYVLKAGDTMTGALEIDNDAVQLVLKRTSASVAWLRFSNSGGILGNIGFDTDGSLIIRNAAWTTNYTVWHSGNFVAGTDYVSISGTETITGVKTFTGGLYLKFANPRVIFQAADGTVYGNIAARSAGVLEFYDLTAYRTVYHSGNSNLSTVNWAAAYLSAYTLGLRRVSDGGVAFQITNPESTAEWRTMASGGGGFFTWYTNVSSTVAERMRLANNGNLGIGTDNPTYKLHVQGTIGCSSGITSTGKLLVSVNANDVAEFKNSSTGIGIVTLGSNGTYGTRLLIKNAANTANSIALDYNGNGTFTGALSCTTLTASGTSGWIGTISSGNNIVYLAHANAGSGPLYLGTTGSASSGYLLRAYYGQTTLGSGGTCALAVRADGNVGIGVASPSYKLHVAGTIVSTGDQVVSSDASLKTNFSKINYSVSDIAACRAVTFDWKDGRGRSAGSIAQDWKPLIPELVHGEEGNMTLAYGQIALVNTIILARHETEQDKEIKRLKARVEDLEKQLKIRS